MKRLHNFNQSLCGAGKLPSWRERAWDYELTLKEIWQCSFLKYFVLFFQNDCFVKIAAFRYFGEEYVSGLEKRNIPEAKSGVPG